MPRAPPGIGAPALGPRVPGASRSFQRHRRDDPEEWRTRARGLLHDHVGVHPNKYSCAVWREATACAHVQWTMRPARAAADRGHSWPSSAPCLRSPTLHASALLECLTLSTAVISVKHVMSLSASVASKSACVTVSSSDDWFSMYTRQMAARIARRRRASGRRMTSSHSARFPSDHAGLDATYK